MWITSRGDNNSPSRKSADSIKLSQELGQLIIVHSDQSVPCKARDTVKKDADCNMDCVSTNQCSITRTTAINHKLSCNFFNMPTVDIVTNVALDFGVWMVLRDTEQCLPTESPIAGLATLATKP